MTRLRGRWVSVRAAKGDAVHLGLGLTIVKLVTEFHSGTVSAATRRDATGVVVSVALSIAS